ncbi:MAG: DUF2807 domain-containing protein [Pyrinomonadaceae bacterium]|nr:DUF2807 domain-containing protein [Pyrinomonadaceae bacterium]
MKRFGFIFFAVALFIGLAASNFFSFGQAGDRFVKFSMDFGTISGNGNVVTEVRNVSGFDGVDVGGIFQVEIVTGKDFKVQVDADENLIGHVVTEVRGGTLYIEVDHKIRSKKGLKVLIEAPAINKVDASGVAAVSLSGIKNDALNIHSSGASKVSVTGEAAELNVDISGATKVLADGLSVTNAKIEASGASFAAVNVSGELNSDLSGASRVEYRGNPGSIVTKKSGASSVTAK